MSTTRRTAGVHSRKRPLGPNGERICYNCGGPLPKGRPFNCSPKCSEEWRCKTSPGHLRFVIFRRDKGICALCGTDTVALKAEYDKIPKASVIEHIAGDGARNAFLKAHNIPWGRVTIDWWDADHIVPVIEGGGECDSTNFRTLCLPCHKTVTKELHGRLKRKRVEAKPLPLFDGE
jgi:5-methylcytosine-specific restriction endonuclease McrA